MVPTCSTTGISASSSIRRPSAALLPSRRTTIGRFTCSPPALSIPIADTIPFATASHEVIPPKTLTSTLRTDGSASTISRPAGICRSGLASM